MLSAPLRRTYRFFRSDGSLTVAVGIIVLFVFVLYPMVEVGAAPRIWLDIAFGLALAFGAYLVFEPRPLMRLFVVFLFAAVALRIVEFFVDARWLTTLSLIFALLACLVFAALLLVRAMRDGRININRIMGAVGSYLLAGVAFSFAYRLLALYVDHAFAMGGTPVDYAQVQSRLPYFSFVTLTATGYGDITPWHPYARSLATLEALFGSLFLTVLVARLVGLEMEWREEKREQRALHRAAAADAAQQVAEAPATRYP